MQAGSCVVVYTSLPAGWLYQEVAMGRVASLLLRRGTCSRHSCCTTLRHEHGLVPRTACRGRDASLNGDCEERLQSEDAAAMLLEVMRCYDVC